MNAPLPKLPALREAMRLPAIRLAQLPARLRAVGDYEDQEFLPAALEIRDTPASPYALGFIWVVAAGFAAALLWSFFAELDIFAVAPGRVQVSGRSKVVQPFDVGKVKTIAVSNGARVKSGELLIALDPTEATADLDARTSQLEAVDAEIARRSAEIKAVRANEVRAEPDFPADVTGPIRLREASLLAAELAQYRATRESTLSQIAEKVAQQERLTSSIAARQRLMAVLRERATMRETLLAKSSGTRAAVIDAIQVVEQTAADLAFDQGQLAESQAAVRSLERKLEQLTEDTITQQAQKVAEAAAKRDGLRQDVIKAALKLDRTRLVAPIDGTVQQLAVTTVGQIVSTGAPLLVVVPNDGAIEIEALVQNRDIGFVSAGQEATVKVDAFPFTRYGTLDGRVVRVSRDAIDDRDASGSTDTLSVARGQGVTGVSGTPKTQNLVFPVTIELATSTIRGDRGDVPVTPGMTTVVEIRTGSRRAIDYLLAPIRETVSQAGHER